MTGRLDGASVQDERKIVGLKSSAEPRNDQVRANRGNENGNEQPVHSKLPQLNDSTDAGGRGLPKFHFWNRGKLRLLPGPDVVSFSREKAIARSVSASSMLGTVPVTQDGENGRGGRA
jgi:hypothetical protein